MIFFEKRFWVGTFEHTDKEGYALKTKGFNLKTEAFCLIGGGENRTLVLGKFPNSDYMLSALILPRIQVQSTSLEPTDPLQSRRNTQRDTSTLRHTQKITIDPKPLGPGLGYRATKGG